MKLQYNDEQHAYWLDGRRCKGATTVAKIPDDMYKINQWRLRMVVTGLALSPPLVERAAAHHDERDQLERIADEAVAIARANEPRDRGTAVHRITERIDSGLDWVHTPLAEAVEIAWSAALDKAGLDIVPGLVERIVVYPQRFIAGTFDRICRRRSDGRHVIADLKTGPNAVRYPHSTAIQLAIYANAPAMAGPLPPNGGTTFEFTELPADLDKTVGYIVHMPAEDEAMVVPIDIAAGWQAVEQIVWPTLEWRARQNLVTVGEGSQLETPPPTEPTNVTETAAYRMLGGPPVDRTPTDPARLAWVRAWIGATAERGLTNQLKAAWPEDIPTPKQGGWTDADISRIAIVLSDIDSRDGKPFWPPDPSTPTPTGIQTTRSKQHEPISQ